MSARLKVWLVGLAVTATAIGPMARDDDSRELMVPLALLALTVLALLAEAASLRSVPGGRTPSRPPAGARPADGVVDVVAMSRVEGAPIPTDPRWRRFVGLERDPLESIGVAPLSPRVPPLLGRVALISVFVGRDGRAWTDPEIVRAHQSLLRAGLWIERQAVRRGAPVNLSLADTFFRVEDESNDPVEVAYSDEGDDVGPMETEAATKHVTGVSRAAARLGFVDVVDLLGRINSRVEGDARVWLIHLRRSGRSLAIPASECDVSGVGLAICFAREASFPEPLPGAGRVDPTTVVHELLHLFGASDKYGVSLGSYPPGWVTSRDVMRLDHQSLSRMTIDPMTASEIGWGALPETDPRTKTARDR
jgi:hypothetical protein